MYIYEKSEFLTTVFSDDRVVTSGCLNSELAGTLQASRAI